MDSVLSHYLNLAAKHNIPVIAAAGNTPHKLRSSSWDICKDSIYNVNLLTNDHMFFPASFSDTMNNMISVTGMENNKKNVVPCFYQNYSPTYITLGVMNENVCCAFKNTHLAPRAVEGSSFSAPVVTGFIGAYLQTHIKLLTAKAYLDVLETKTEALHQFTVKGKYIPYNDKW
jgi:Subtilase family